jgi:hypothetical protein
MRRLVVIPFVLLQLLLIMGADCDVAPVVDGGPAEGEPEPPCIIGDENGEAELVLVYRTVDGEVADLVDNGEVPLILPPQGGKVTLIGVRAKNVTCRLLLNGSVSNSLCGGNIIGLEGRPIDLEVRDDGFGYPAAPDTLDNYVNIALCPNASSTRDSDGQPYALQVRATEVRRLGEDVARTHVMTATITPVCAEPDIFDTCRCTCDADFINGVPEDEQCPGINDNDIEPGTCPVE